MVKGQWSMVNRQQANGTGYKFQGFTFHVCRFTNSEAWNFGNHSRLPIHDNDPLAIVQLFTIYH